MGKSLHDRSRLAAALAFCGAATLATAAYADDVAPAPADPVPAGASVAEFPVSQPQGPVEPPTEPEKKRFVDRLFDEQDGMLDFSEILAKGGFLPVLIVITEKAVDGGYGVAPAFLSADPNNPRLVTKHIFGAFKTGNGSNGFGYFQAGYAAHGRLSYKFGVAHGKVTLGSYPAFLPKGVEYTSHYDYGLLGSALWKLNDERFSIGPLFDFRKLNSQIDIRGLPPRFADHFGGAMQTGALGLGFHFDDRDNPLSPTNGLNVLVEGKFNRDAFGSDRDYETYDAAVFAFHKLSPRLGLGFKLEANAIRNDFPVYYAPAIDLRGVEAMRYEGEDVVSSEVEATWRLNPRWSLLAFAGVGSTKAGNSRIYKDSGPIYAGGAGFRYRLARKLGLDAGIDVAYGPDGATFYIQFGHAWALKMD
ncbi:MAG: hypothetical protein J7521_16825 [Caulobacter sp.]|nr:hypothetical protein [Caulobacter sp.]